MTNYEEKKQARIERYNELAGKAGARSNDLANESSEMVRAIPMGQPIMPDHHSYKSDVAYRERAGNKMRKSFEESDKAEYYKNKAEAAESNTAISSDDPEALTKLKSKLESLQAHQVHAKKINAYYKKVGTLDGCEFAEDYDHKALASNIAYSWDKRPYASFTLTNNNSKMKATKDRIARLEQSANTEYHDILFTGGAIHHDTEQNRVQLIFDDVPDAEVRAICKSFAFRWSRANTAWQRQLTRAGQYAARSAVKEIEATQGE
jgi:hypothetical protein